jgi:hypothetical protein
MLPYYTTWTHTLPPLRVIVALSSLRFVLSLSYLLLLLLLPRCLSVFLNGWDFSSHRIVPASVVFFCLRPSCLVTAFGMDVIIFFLNVLFRCSIRWYYIESNINTMGVVRLASLRARYAVPLVLLCYEENKGWSGRGLARMRQITRLTNSWDTLISGDTLETNRNLAYEGMDTSETLSFAIMRITTTVSCGRARQPLEISLLLLKHFGPSFPLS